MGESFLMRRGGAVVREVTAGVVVVDMVSVLRRLAGGEVGGDVMLSVCWSVVEGIVWWWLWLWLRLEGGGWVGFWEWEWRWEWGVWVVRGQGGCGQRDALSGMRIEGG